MDLLLSCLLLSLSSAVGTEVTRKANISCTTGLFQDMISYNISNIPGCDEKYFPKLRSGNACVPAAPVNFSGTSRGREFDFKWRTRKDAGGSYAVVKGFKMVFWVQNGIEYPYNLSDCYFIHVIPPDYQKINTYIHGEFILRCSYHDSQRIILDAILSSYPTPHGCYGTKDNPKWRRINLTLKALSTWTPTIATTTVSSVTYVPSDDKNESSYIPKVLYASAAALTCTISVICLLRCFIRQRKLHAGSPTPGRIGEVIETVDSTPMPFLHSSPIENQGSAEGSKRSAPDKQVPKPCKNQTAECPSGILLNSANYSKSYAVRHSLPCVYSPHPETRGSQTMLPESVQFDVKENRSDVSWPRLLSPSHKFADYVSVNNEPDTRNVSRKDTNGNNCSVEILNDGSETQNTSVAFEKTVENSKPSQHDVFHPQQLATPFEHAIYPSRRLLKNKEISICTNIIKHNMSPISDEISKRLIEVNNSDTDSVDTCI